MKKEYEDIITKTVGVEPLKINSALVSCANRSRIYWTNVLNRGVPAADMGIMLKSIIGDYSCIYVVPRGFNQKKYHSYKGKCPTITAHGSWKHNFFYVRDGQHHKFTIEQAEQIMGLPIGYTSVVSETRRWACVGNGWQMDTIQYLFQGLKKELE
jgi:site-specific DNA-cytosine methylase